MKFSEFLSTTVIIACAVESVASHRDNSENIKLLESVNEILNDLQELEQEMNFYENVGSALVGETCDGFNGSTGSSFPHCAPGLDCVPLDGGSIPGAGNRCVEGVDEKEKEADVGETCDGFNSSTGSSFPHCAPGLECLSFAPWMMTIPGAGKRCVDHGDARLGDTCGGFNESTGSPGRWCEFGLFCARLGLGAATPLGGAMMPGSGSRCVKLVGSGGICDGFDEYLGTPFPPCKSGLRCEPLDPDETYLPGQGNRCF